MWSCTVFIITALALILPNNYVECGAASAQAAAQLNSQHTLSQHPAGPIYAAGPHVPVQTDYSSGQAKPNWDQSTGQSWGETWNSEGHVTLTTSSGNPTYDQTANSWENGWNTAYVPAPAPKYSYSMDSNSPENAVDWDPMYNNSGISSLWRDDAEELGMERLKPSYDTNNWQTKSTYDTDGWQTKPTYDWHSGHTAHTDNKAHVAPVDHWGHVTPYVEHT